jgi:peptide/nickel transport system permease protein
MMLTAACAVLVTVASFAALDALGDRDWFDAARYAPALGLDARGAATGELPLVWNAAVADARARTHADLDALSKDRARPAAEVRLARRGSAALPVVMMRLPRLAPDARLAALRVLSGWSRGLTGAEASPVPARAGDDRAAIAWWDGFYSARLLDFRPGYTARQAERLAAHDSRNAVERVSRLGTYALPALVQTLAVTQDRAGVARVAGALSDLTGVSLRLGPDASPAAVTRVVEGWKAFWFARHLEYETLSPWRLTLGHVTETRYGHWVARALRGRFGVSRVTGRPVSLELRERLPLSSLTSGLGGLFAVAGVIAFGGGPSMRRRALRVKLLDLVGALVPGLAAFVGAWTLLLRLCAPAGGATHAALALLTGVDGMKAALAVAGCAALASQWLRRPGKRLVLHAVRVEAEAWVAESLAPTGTQVLRHGARIGVASLLAPLGLAGPAVLLASLVVELVFGLRGMGALTVRALATLDAPWLMVAAASLVPLFLARRQAVGLLGWLLAVRSAAKPTAPDTADAPPAPPPTPPPRSPPSA